ncbi:MAG: S41 family peptidase [bacterium]|nr:S41 family peptidase [bacterium]
MKSRNLLFVVLFFVSLINLPLNDLAQSSSAAISVQNPNSLKQQDIYVLSEILLLIEKNYYKEVNMGECVQKIMKGGVSRCTDRYSFYLNIDEVKLEKEEHAGHFYGVGMRMAQKTEKGEHYIVILSVLKNTPAEKAGLKSGDYVVAVSSDGIKEHAVGVENLNMNELLGLIRGDKDKSPIFIRIYRKKENQSLEFNLIREDIKIEIVSSKILEPKVGYVRVSDFFGDLRKDFLSAVINLKSQGAEVLVLDLRDNPGGFLSFAVHLSELFRTSNFGYVVYTVGRDQVKEPVNLWSDGAYGFPMDRGRFKISSFDQ